MRKFLLLSILFVCFAINKNLAQCSITTSAISGSSGACANTNGVTYSVTNNTGSTYAWTITGGTPVAPSTTNSITINWGAAGSGNVKVVETFTGGCVGNAVNLPLTIYAIPNTPAISGPTSTCQNISATYSVAGSANSRYMWNATGGTPYITYACGFFNTCTTNVSGAIISNNTIKVSWTGPGTLTVVETSSVGCVGVPVSLTMSSIQTPVIVSAPSSRICIGETMQMNPSTGGSWSIINSTAPSVASITSSGAITGLTNGIVTTAFLSSSGCTTMKNITVGPPDAQYISGLSSVCANQTNVTYTYPNTTGSTYGWTVTGGGTIVSGNGTNSIIVNWGSTGSGNVSVVETASGGCSSLAVNFPVTINPATLITIQPSIGSQNVCQGTSPSPLSVTATGTGTLSYTWYASDTAVPGTNGSSVSGAISAFSSGSTYTPSMIGTYYYWVVASGTCGQVYSNVSGAITINPTTAITTQPDPTLQTVCQNASVTPLSVAATGAGTLSYQWYSNAINTNTGGTAITGATNSTFTPPTSSAGTTYYYVTANGSCGLVTSNVSGAITILPATAFTTQPSLATQTLCLNASASPLSVTGTGVGTLSYNWYVNTTNSNVGGSFAGGANTVTPFSWNPGTYYYYAIVSGSCGYATSNVSGAVTINPLTSITVQPSTVSQAVCQGSSVSPLTVTGTGAGPLNYQWFRNTANSNIGGSTIVGATASSYTPSSATAGTTYYYVVITGPCGSSTSTVSGPITIWPTSSITSQPSSISQNVCQGTILPPLAVTANSSSYQWYSNSVNSNTGGSAISGEAYSNYYPSSATAGTTYYYVVVTNNCASVPSNVSGAITINPSTAITAQPSSAAQNIAQGGSASPLSLTATGSGSLSYQWYSNTANSNSGGTQISGATASTYTPSSATAGTMYYYVVVTGACGSVTSNVSGAINIIKTTITTQPSSTAQTFCLNATTTPLSVVASGLGTLNYQWFNNSINSNTGGAAISGATSSSYTPPSTVPGVTYYYVVVSCASGSATSNVSGAITISTPNTSAITGFNSVCINTNGVVYSVTNTTGSTYNWTITGGAVASGQGTNAITVNWTTAGAGNVKVVETSAAGCVGTAVNKSVTVNALPVTSTITGPSPVCANASGVVYSVTNTTGSTYAWTVTGTTGTSLVSGNGTNSIIVNWGAAGTGTVKVVETNVNGCVGAAVTKSVTINANPNTSVISGSATACPNSTGNAYTVTNTVGSTYNWIITGGTKATGGTTSSITVTWGIGGTGNVSVIETNAAGCVGATINKAVPVSPLTSPISGNVTVCPNSNGVAYSVANVTGDNYTWTATGGAVVCGQNTSTILVNWGAAGPGTLSVTERSATCTGVPVSLPVTITTTPSTSVITGSAAVCSSASGVAYSVTNTSGSTYAWTVSGGTLVSGNGSSNILVNWSTSGTGNVSVVETSSTGCVGTTVNKLVTIGSPTTSGITGNTNLCVPSNGITYSVTNTPGSTYVWAINGGTPVASSTTNSITVNWGPSGSGSVRVTETNSAGCVGATVSQVVTVNPTPATSAIAGNISVCPNASGVSYSVTNSPGSTYVWTISGGGTPAAPSTTNSITVNWGAVGTGNVSVLETNNFGCVGLPVNLPVTINALPTITVSPASATISYGGSISLTASGASTYSWSPPTGLNTTTGATVIASPTVSTTYTVSGTDARGCVGTKTVLVSPTCTPPSIVISASNGFNLCKVSSTTLTATAISGATYTWTSSAGDYSKTGTTTNGGNTLLVYDEETYTVSVNVSGCIGSASATTIRTGTLCNAPIVRVAAGSQPTKPTESEDEPKGHKISVHPNPANHEMIVETPKRAEQDTQVVLYDMMGRVSGSGILKKGEWQVTISTSEVANGMYVVRIGTGDQASAEKVIIEHK